MFAPISQPVQRSITPATMNEFNSLTPVPAPITPAQTLPSSSQAPSQPSTPTDAEATHHLLNSVISTSLTSVPMTVPATQSAVHLALTDRPSFLNFLNTFTTREQYRILTSVAERIIQVEHMKNEMSEFIESTARKLGCTDLMSRDAHIWTEMREFARRARDDRDRKATSMKRVLQMWPDSDVHGDFGELVSRNVGSTTWRALQSLSAVARRKGWGYAEMKMGVLRAQVERLGSRAGKRGTRTNIGIEAQDLNAARRAIESGERVDVQTLRAELMDSAYGVSRFGFIVRADTEEDVGVEMLGVGRLIGGVERVKEHDSSEDDELYLGSERMESLDPRLIGQGLGVDVSGNTDGADQQRVQPDGSSPMLMQWNSTDFFPNYIPDTMPVKSEPPDGLAAELAGNSGISGRAHECGCTPQVSSAFLKRIRKDLMVNPTAQASLIKTWHDTAMDHLCYPHTRLIVSALGMKGHTLSIAELKQRLEVYYRAVMNSKLGELKTDQATYGWFRRSHRPARMDDRLGPYKYRHIDTTNFELSSEHQKDLCRYLGIDQTKWTHDGNIVLDCFDWWRTMKYPAEVPSYEHLAGRSIYDVVLEEFDMYSHHQRPNERSAGSGILHVMVHSLGQQILRQDPKYYLMYMALREDRNIHLVSHPYYTTCQQEGAQYASRQIDINIPRLLTASRGKYRIQGSLSLDDEEPDDCLEVLPGMHRHFDEWAPSLSQRGINLGGVTHSIGRDEFTAEDAKKYNTDWTAVPCKALQIRIAQPHLPHGTKGPAKRISRTMSPWFMGLQSDLETLEITEAGTFDQLSKAHRDLTSAIHSPSGHLSMTGNIPYAFPGAVRLTGLSALSESLVAQISPVNPLVIKEKSLLLLGCDRDRDCYLTAWQEMAVRKVVEAFEDVKRFEKEAFGNKSYWYRKENGILDAAPSIDADCCPERTGSGLNNGQSDEST